MHYHLSVTNFLILLFFFLPKLNSSIERDRYVEYGMAGAGVGRVSRTTTSPRVRWIFISPTSSLPYKFHLQFTPIIHTLLHFLRNQFLIPFPFLFDLINDQSCLAAEETVAVDLAAAAAAPAAGI